MELSLLAHYRLRKTAQQPNTGISSMSFLQKILKQLRTKSRTWPTDPVSVAAMKLIEEGQTEEKAGRLDNARLRYEEAVSIAPHMAKAHMNLGNAYRSIGSIDRAFTAYSKAVELDPESPHAHYNLGNTYWHFNKFSEALRCYLRATNLDPSFSHPWIAMGNTLGGMGNFREAIDACNQAIKIDPENSEAYFVRSIVHRAAGNYDSTISDLRRTLQISPDHAFALTNIANYLEEELEFEEALMNFKKISKLNPSSVDDWTRVLHRLYLDVKISPEEIFKEHVTFGDNLEESEYKNRFHHENSREKDRVLRVGFVSADLIDHAVSYFFEPILRGICQRADLALYAYHNRNSGSETTSRIKAKFLHWRDVWNLTDDELSNLIRSDKIDILIDLSGHTEKNRLRVFARKPAPIQASWIGYPGTTGLRSIDYYFADHHFLSDDQLAKQFVENIVYLPSTSLFRPINELPSINTLPAANSGYLTFGSFNRSAKINREVVSVWGELLRALPDSKLVIAGLAMDRRVDIYKRWLEEEQIIPARFSFRPRTDTATYLLSHHDVDICLDTFPYSGGTTTNIALLMGLPTLTLVGRTPASRQSASLNSQLGLSDFIATSPGQFVSLGTMWAKRTTELAEIRNSLRARVEASPIQDIGLMTSAFANALRIMWCRWCINEPAEPIDVSGPK